MVFTHVATSRHLTLPHTTPRKRTHPPPHPTPLPRLLQDSPRFKQTLPTIVRIQVRHAQCEVQHHDAQQAMDKHLPQEGVTREERFAPRISGWEDDILTTCKLATCKLTTCSGLHGKTASFMHHGKC